MKIEIKHRYTGAVLFSHECENNTLKITVEEAVKADANLRDANLRDANLVNANLRDANLRDANLVNANLRDANLRNAKNASSAIKVPMFCKWSHGITNNNLVHIGCEKRTIEEWDKFFASNEVISTKRDTPEFKQIQAVYEGYKAYLTFLGGTHFNNENK